MEEGGLDLVKVEILAEIIGLDCKDLLLELLSVEGGEFDGVVENPSELELAELLRQTSSNESLEFLDRSLQVHTIINIDSPL